MSVYTEVTFAELSDFLGLFAVGELLSFKGIESGVENTNFFVTTSQGEFVLTIFEQLTTQQLDTLMGLAYHLGQQGINVPAPVTNVKQQLLQQLKGKPAVLCPRLTGQHIQTPTAEHCFAIGQSLAKFHLSAQSYSKKLADPFHLDWWQKSGVTLIAHLSQSDQDLFHSEIAAQQQALSTWQSLPSGWIHADLFHDNALWNGDEFAILDLYAACHGAYIYDLAILANDWCCDEAGHWQDGRVEALFNGYESVRKLSAQERSSWNLALRAGALRWWLGRLESKHFQAGFSGGLALKKDPDEYKNKLIVRRQA